MTTEDRPSLLELGRRRGAELAAEKPLSPALSERLAEMIRPALLHASERPVPPRGLTCARTGTVTTACVAGTTGTCVCRGWTA